MTNLFNLSIDQVKHNGDEVVLMKLNGNIVYDIYSNRIEYTVDGSSLSLHYKDFYGRLCAGLPRIYSDDSTYTFDGYDRIKIIKKDGIITEDTSTSISNISKVIIYYSEEIHSIRFYGGNSSGGTFEPFVTSIGYCNTSNFVSMKEMFHRCTYLTSVNMNNWDTSNVTDMSSMFYSCGSLTSLDLSSFNTINVTDMEYMFCNCYKLTSLDLSNFDTSNVTNMYGMFHGCQSLTSLDLSNFNTNNVTDMDSMFHCCYKLTTLRLDNCSYDTISKIINSYNFPTNVIDGQTRTIYCKRANAEGLTAPENWVFSYID